MDWVIEHSYLIPLLPLIGAAIAGFFGAKWLKGLSHWPIWIGVGISALLAIVLLFNTMGLAGGEKHGEDHGISGNKLLFNWIEAGDPGLKGTDGHPQLVHDKPDSRAY